LNVYEKQCTTRLERALKGFRYNGGNVIIERYCDINEDTKVFGLGRTWYSDAVYVDKINCSSLKLM